VRPLVDARQQALEVELPDDPVYLLGDGVRLAQVFSNLLNNAAKYSETGAKISIAARVVGNKLRVDVVDTGAGISAQAIPAVFEMFSQGDNSVERTQSGLGVGLALAKQLVELHGGSIEVCSPGLDLGSVFTVWLPLEAHAAKKPAPVQPTIEPERHRILLVDDNIDFATSLALLLREVGGHDVRIAHDAEEALRCAREFRPEFGILDLGLPRTSGYALARELHSRAETADIALIALSGWGQEPHRRRSQDAGFALHLVKPAALADIQGAIDSLVRGR
jgi:CheY-like chemotaxis protein/anti-sigma regulatory factor (Ser/Thr protein kinase)